MYAKHKDTTAFLLVYIQEAHATDGWPMDSNTKEGVCHASPKSMDERRELARLCTEALKLSIPCAVDGLDNPVDIGYAAWPERMFVVDGGGTLVYAGKAGPWGFKPEEVEAVLQGLAAKQASRKSAKRHR